MLNNRNGNQNILGANKELPNASQQTAQGIIHHKECYLVTPLLREFDIHPKDDIYCIQLSPSDVQTLWRNIIRKTLNKRKMEGYTNYCALSKDGLLITRQLLLKLSSLNNKIRIHLFTKNETPDFIQQLFRSLLSKGLSKNTRKLSLERQVRLLAQAEKLEHQSNTLDELYFPKPAQSIDSPQREEKIKLQTRYQLPNTLLNGAAQNFSIVFFAFEDETANHKLGQLEMENMGKTLDRYYVQNGIPIFRRIIDNGIIAIIFLDELFTHRNTKKDSYLYLNKPAIEIPSVHVKQKLEDAIKSGNITNSYSLLDGLNSLIALRNVKNSDSKESELSSDKDETTIVVSPVLQKDTIMPTMSLDKQTDTHNPSVLSYQFNDNENEVADFLTTLLIRNQTPNVASSSASQGFFKRSREVEQGNLPLPQKKRR